MGRAISLSTNARAGVGEVEIVVGDSRKALREFSGGTFQACITSPPYWGLRDYGIEGQIGAEPTLGLYLENVVEIFRQVRRVLRDDGTLWLNIGDSYTSGNRGWRDPDKKNPARGEYLVNRVAMCGDCHTPRGPKGGLDRERPFQGAALRFGPSDPSDRAGFARCAPAIAGMRFWTKAQSIRFLETGLTPGGAYAKPLMPRFRLARGDAAAMVAYLRSLSPASSEPCAASAKEAAKQD